MTNKPYEEMCESAPNKPTVLPERVIVLYLVYGSACLEEGLHRIKNILQAMLPKIRTQFVVIDNALINTPIKSIDDNMWVLPGDNSLWEFSGWDYGLDFARKNLLLNKGDLVLFANDTFFRRNYRDGGLGYLDFFNVNVIAGHDLTAEAIGYLDDFPKQASLLGIQYSSWIRSNIFFLPGDICEKLGSLCFPLADEEVFSERYLEFWSSTGKISANWKAYISSWLFGKVDPEFPEYRLHWFKAEPISQSNFGFFRTKAKCILSEHYLTARLYALGAQIIDTNLFEKLPNRHITPYYG